MSKQEGGAAVMNAIPGKPVWVLLVAAVICGPCFAEPQPANGAKVATKLDCGGAVSGEGLSKSGVQHVAPKVGERGGVDGGAKDGCGGAPGVQTVNVEQRQDAKKASEQRGGPSGDEIAHTDWWVVLRALVPILMFIGDGVLSSRKHNVM